MRSCSIDGCEGAHTAKGLCRRHWMQQYTPSRIWGDDDMKRCPGCETEKLGTEFYADAKRGKGTYCRDCTRAKARNWWQSQAPESRRGSHRMRKFGITRERYDVMHEEQGGLCAICGEPETTIQGGTLTSLAVDHDHITGRIGQLLCRGCNTALGLFGDSPERLEAAAQYLRSHRG